MGFPRFLFAGFPVSRLINDLLVSEKWLGASIAGILAGTVELCICGLLFLWHILGGVHLCGWGSYRGVSHMLPFLEICSWVGVLIAVLRGFSSLARNPGTEACYTLVTAVSKVHDC